MLVTKNFPQLKSQTNQTPQRQNNKKQTSQVLGGVSKPVVLVDVQENKKLNVIV